MNYMDCWNCKKEVSFQERVAADGNCPHCNQELDLEDAITQLQKRVKKLELVISRNSLKVRYLSSLLPAFNGVTTELIDVSDDLFKAV